MVRLTQGLLLGVAVALVGPGCETAPSAQTVLVVQSAQEQPSSDGLGIILVVQSLGGAWLEFEVAGGTLVGGSHSACLAAPDSGSLRDNTIDVLVYPEQVEAVVTVRLLPNAARTAGGEAGAGEGVTDTDGTTELGACHSAARPLREVIRPVQRVATVVTGGAGVAGASSGAGTSGIGGHAGSSGTAGSGAIGGAAGAPDTGGTGGSGAGGEPATAGVGAASGESGAGG